MNSRVAIPLDGSTRLFTIPFPFIAKQHVTFAVNRVIQFEHLNYVWTGENTVEFITAPSGVLEIRRNTPSDGPLVSFYNGAVLTEAELNLAIRQSLYICQEIRDHYDALINGALDSLVLATGNEEAGPVIDRVVAEILDSELLAELQQRITDIDVNASTILETRLRLNDVEAVVDALATIEGEDIATVILNEKAERIDGDTALAQTLALIGAKSGDGMGFILDMDTVRVNLTETLAQRLSVIESGYGDALSLITAETTARTDALSALASTVDGMLAQLDDDLRALVLDERAAWVAGDAAEASARSTLQTKVNEHTASISTHAASINGIQAQWTLKTDVNGLVAGIGLMNTGATSDFIVNAHRFAVATPGQNPVVPFAVDANGVYMNTAYIRNLVVDKISGGAINSQWAINSTSGRIVLDTGTHMKVLGVGFGANSDLIEWFGPKMAINACTKANGTTWVSTDGSAYFGGTLTAGIIRNAVRTTDIGANASVTNGPFGTNGNRKTVVVSYSFDRVQRTFGTWGTPSGNNSATLRLYRRVGAGNESLIQTAIVTGSHFIINDPDPSAPSHCTSSIGGSFTFTDNTTSQSDFTYRADIQSRTVATVPLSGTVNFSEITQSLGVISTEE